MAKRIFELTPADVANLDRQGLLKAIVSSVGRTLLAEAMATVPPLLGSVSNAELAAAMGADVIVLNVYDVQQPLVMGLPSRPEAAAGLSGTLPGPVAGLVSPETLGLGVTVGDVKRLIGRPVGIMLEPGPEGSIAVPPGRRATPDNCRLALDQGADLIVISGNPGTGVTWPVIVAATKAAHKAVGDRVVIVAGEMHYAGPGGEGGRGLFAAADISDLAKAGADVVLLPAPGTVQGVTVAVAAGWVEAAHAAGMLALLAIGTSQEGSAVETVTRIAELTKQAGADICHIGDAGYCGMAMPENIMAYSTAIRGRAHTYRRIALGFRR
ncbi:MAG TPA: haloacid dehalogenase-like hydrolase [Symbiobacteriaceae bacterium]|jgi:hypothetical protein